jgi:phosphopantetheinyl transferase (holo-ACP synthase)
MPIVPFPEFLALALSLVGGSVGREVVMVDLDRLRVLIRKKQEQRLCEQWLHRDEQERLYGLRHPKRHSEWLGGRIAAKSAVIAYLDSRRDPQAAPVPPLEASSFQIQTAASGRPFLAPETVAQGIEVPYISISHSQGYALAVSATTCCGVDIQVGRASLLRIKDRFCSCGEQSVLAMVLPALTPLERLTLLWAAKEAVKKGVACAPMPGFLELQLISIHHPVIHPCQDVEADLLPVFSFLFKRFLQQQECSPSPDLTAETPSMISVAVGLYQGYGLALCLFPAHAGFGGTHA